MARTADELYAEALALSDEERVRLLLMLEDSCDDFELTPEYRAELERRIGEIQAGTAELVDADEAIRELRTRFKPVVT